MNGEPLTSLNFLCFKKLIWFHTLGKMFDRGHDSYSTVGGRTQNSWETSDQRSFRRNAGNLHKKEERDATTFVKDDETLVQHI